MQDRPTNSGPDAGHLLTPPQARLRQRRLLHGHCRRHRRGGPWRLRAVAPVHAIQTAWPNRPWSTRRQRHRPAARAAHAGKSSPFSFADLVERVSPAVVTITSARPSPPTAIMDDQRQYLPRRSAISSTSSTTASSRSAAQGDSAPARASSSTRRALIVTNNHVVDNGKKITVKLPDGRSFDRQADRHRSGHRHRLAQDQSRQAAAHRGIRRRHAKLRVGDWVVAVGNPFGLSNSVTAGIVSSIGRDIESAGNYNDFIQIDAPINRGNSGGPTFDLRGQVIGMNSMIFSPSGGSVGIGFAIPASHHPRRGGAAQGAWPCLARLVWA